VQKRLNRSICRLGCGLGWTEGSTSSIVLARWHQCDFIGGHICATWRIRLNHPSAVVMRPYVKLLWPLVYSILLTHCIFVHAACCCRPSIAWSVGLSQLWALQKWPNRSRCRIVRWMGSDGPKKLC